MKKYFVVAYILLITAACSLPFVGMICGWGAKSTENRTMTGLPDLYTAEEDRIDPNLNYTAELGEYYSDNFGFRQELVTAHSWLNETVFGRSSNEKTVVGKRGWYYLSETIDDYTGVSALSDRGIYRLQKTLDLMNEFVVPNKLSIYPEYMPDSIMASEKPSNLDRLNKAMRARLYFLDVKSVLVKSAKDRTRYIYLKNDSHWNNIGALAAYNAPMGKYAVAGEADLVPESLRVAMEAAGVNLLEDEYVVLSRGNDRIGLVGLREKFSFYW